MESSPDVDARRRTLEAEARRLVRPRSAWMRTALNGRDVCLLCGTLGAEFDAWQRRLAATSAADALLSQQIGLDLVEAEMDRVERAAREAVAAEGRTLQPRRSPGYGDLPLALSREIIARLDATKRLGVGITDSDLLVPSKSVTAICEFE